VNVIELWVLYRPATLIENKVGIPDKEVYNGDVSSYLSPLSNCRESLGTILLLGKPIQQIRLVFGQR
jgi:hypothetical protein